MAKFHSPKPDLVVSTANGFIQFKNGVYVTTDKKEIEALRKSSYVTEDKQQQKVD